MKLRLARGYFLRGGFSLVEVMTGVVVVAILFVSLFVGLAQGFSLSAVARERLRANQIALERIEGIRLVKWDDLTKAHLVPLGFTAEYAPGSALSGVNYTGTVTMVTPTFSGSAPSYAANMKHITVHVTWTSGSRTFNHTVSTLVARSGMQNYIYEN
jgi:prepilin-type N-terminal cleavage/methylation domain-containing protein